MDKKEL